MITVDTPIVGRGSGQIAIPDEAKRELDVLAYQRELIRLCRLVNFNEDILIAQAWHETAGFTSRWWNDRLNPAGIGITGDPAQNEASRTWAHGTDAARAHVVHMAGYVLAVSAEIWRELWPYAGLDPRLQAVYDAGLMGTVRVLGDLGNGKWATDPDYAEKITAKANQIFKEVTMPTIVAKECPIIIDVVTEPMVNRPALAMPDASFVTVHEVGNRAPGANAKMHRDFVHNGGGENAVSFHFVVGDDVAYQLIYLNENAWHASDYYSGRGNRDSIAIETIQIGDKAKTRAHLAYLIAEIYRNPDRFLWRADVPRLDDLAPALARERTKRHRDWAPDNKLCPEDLIVEGMWPVLLDGVAAALADVAPELPKYASPILPEWWSEQALLELRSHREDGVLYKPLGSRVTATKETGAYAHPWLPEGKGKRTRANIGKGETVDLRFIANHPTTKEQWGITRFGTWISLKHFSPRFTVRNVTPD